MLMVLPVPTVSEDVMTQAIDRTGRLVPANAREH